MSAHKNCIAAEHYPDDSVRLGIRLHRRGLEHREIITRMLEKGLPFPEMRALQTWSNGETKQSLRIISTNPGLWP